MDFWEVIQKRRSVRKFKSDDVEQDKIDRLIKAAYLAPCGSNVKNWYFVVVKDPGTKEAMRKAVESRIGELADKMKSQRAKSDFLSYGKYFTFFSEAPVVVAVIMKKYDSLSARILKRYEDNATYMSTAGVQNVSAAIENMLLACAAEGLGACWMTGPMLAKEKLERILEVEEPDDLLALIPVGIPQKEPASNKIPASISEFVKNV